MSSVKDSDIYSRVLSTLKETFEPIYNRSDDSYILAISRKGPRMLESIFKGGQMVEDSEHLNVITELSMPFFFNYLKNKEQKPSVIYLYDDAVYFGTTIESVLRDIDEYLKIYNLSIRVKPWTGVMTAEAKNLDFHVSSAVTDVRRGYGHYFIRRLTRDIRKLCMPFELEFPIIYFCLPNTDLYNVETKENLLAHMKDVFGNSNVYEVNYNNESLYNITVLLNSDDDLTSIKKLRIFPSPEGQLAVTCIAPNVFPNIENAFDQAWDNDYLFKEMWNEIYAESLANEDVTSVELLRNRRKSLVAFYSYLLSFRCLLNIKYQLIKALGRDGKEIEPVFEGVKEKDLFYLLGNRDLAERVKSYLDFLWHNDKKPELYPRRIIKYPSFPVFELPDFPSAEERGLLEYRNIEGIKKCNTIQQALSVLFFNQNCLIEKWSRKFTKYDHRRLRFGQTFESIYQNVKTLKKEGTQKEIISAINKWIDRRIDQGCVVPQYVRSVSDNNWYRVFRPGENEDAILSHLSRIVLLVFTEYERITGRTELDNFTLNELLTLPFLKAINLADFSLELGIPLIIQGPDILCYRDDDTNNYESIIKYLLDVDILEENDKLFKPSKRINDDDLLEVTTLDAELENHYRSYIDKILFDMDKVDPRLYYTVFNFYRFNASEQEIRRKEEEIFNYADECDSTMMIVEHLSKQSNRKVNPMSIFEKLIMPYTALRARMINEMFWMKDSSRLSELSNDREVLHRILIIQEKLVQLRAVIEFMMYSYVHSNYASLRLRIDYYAGNQSPFKGLFSEFRETLLLLSDKDNFERNIWDHHLILSFRSFINNVIKYER